MNTQTGFYEGVEDGITYQLTFEQMNALKAFFHLLSSGYEPRILTWYNSLSGWEKQKVKRLNAPLKPDDFFPDPEWTEQ